MLTKRPPSVDSGLGSRYLERPVGGSGRAEVFSCSPTKVVTSGEGGIVATNDADLAERVRIGRNYGNDGSYDCALEGINARMSEFHAILGLASLKAAEENIAHRLHLIGLYKQRLEQLPGIRFQKTSLGGVSNGVYFSIIVDPDRLGLRRDQLYKSLGAEGIDTRRYYYPPLHLQQVNSRRRHLYSLPQTERVAENSLTLPVFSHMTEEQVNGVCDAIDRLHKYEQLIESQWDEILPEENL